MIRWQWIVGGIVLIAVILVWIFFGPQLGIGVGLLGALGIGTGSRQKQKERNELAEERLHTQLELSQKKVAAKDAKYDKEAEHAASTGDLGSYYDKHRRD